MKLWSQFIRPAVAVMLLVISSCNSNQTTEIHEVEWKTREVKITENSSFEYGSTYLSIYSSIYSYSEQSTTNLTATASIRNIDESDTIFLSNASYFNTEGELVRSYFDYPIYVAPLETIEIVVHQSDETGGTGGNFVFDWFKDSTSNEPYFEAVMISMSSQQGLSFSTKGKRIK